MNFAVCCFFSNHDKQLCKIQYVVVVVAAAAVIIKIITAQFLETCHFTFSDLMLRILSS